MTVVLAWSLSVLYFLSSAISAIDDWLITDLENFPNVSANSCNYVTTKSCQGDEQSPAWVYFSYGSGHWQEVAKFTLGHLGPRLAQQLGEQARLSICMTPSGKAQGELLVRPGAMQDCVEVMRALANLDPSAFAGANGGSATPMSAPMAPPTATVDMVDPPIPSQ